MDGQNQMLVEGANDAWDHVEMYQVFDAARIAVRFGSEPSPPLREDGVRLEPSPWLRRVAAMPPIGLAGVVLARLDVVPPIPVLIFAAVTILAGVVMWASGFFASARRGPGVIAGEKLMAKLQAKEQAKRAKEEAKKKRRQQRGKQ